MELIVIAVLVLVLLLGIAQTNPGLDRIDPRLWKYVR